MMMIPTLLWHFISTIFMLVSPTMYNISVLGQCLNSQKSFLLQLRNDLTFSTAASTKMSSWNESEDCCSWNGVGCHDFIHVTTLELDSESISGGIDNSSSLFRLEHLETLNLANNNFSSIPIPREISSLRNLVHLNLSNSGFTGQIPIELSTLRKLISLDLSTPYRLGYQPTYLLKFENPGLEPFLNELSQLEEVYLDGVELSTDRINWGRDLSTSLPNLVALSLRGCNISGPIDPSLVMLKSLSVIRLDGNRISSTVPGFIANISKLETLSLGSCGLLGQFPEKVFQIPTLKTLDISYNELLTGRIPRFAKNSSLRTIMLTSTSFSGTIPYSISNAHNLSSISLYLCKFHGQIPPTMADLTELASLDFSINNFSGPIPSFKNSTKLRFINLASNHLEGTLSQFEGFQYLQHLRLTNNSFIGRVPENIFHLPSLRILDLSRNLFSGRIPDIPSTSSLSSLELDSNNFSGSIPMSFFELRMLDVLSLYNNSFSGTVRLKDFSNLPNFTRLDLSFNNLTVELSGNMKLINIRSLSLASCNIEILPELLMVKSLEYLDLAENKIRGELPHWIWNIGGEGKLFFLNLSCNSLVGLEKPYSFSNLMVLDLHSNNLTGDMPSIPPFSMFVDYSKNHFSGTIPDNIGMNISKAEFFSISYNQITGSVPQSMCEAKSLAVLDLSYNILNGDIPPCLVNLSSTLGVLNLAGNNLSGSMPDVFPISCSLQTLDLGANKFGGKFPRSVHKCTSLEVLNIGENKVEDKFPCLLQNSSNLRVLVLRSNKLYGELHCFGLNNSWSRLQIFDISSNNFSGNISTALLSSLTNMMSDVLGRSDHLHANVLTYLANYYYQDKVTVTMKGNPMDLVKVLSVFKSLDFSSNKLTGEIPHAIGDLVSLYVLNLSHNDFRGQIPSSIGQLRNLGSLDLSENHLTGTIPDTLTKLTFLSFLNLSINNLYGQIPLGTQLQTFSGSSYYGNAGLCGEPLDVRCGTKTSSPPISNVKDGIEWEYVSASIGFSVGLGTYIVLLLFCKNWRIKFFQKIEDLMLDMLSLELQRRIAPQRFRREGIRWT